MMLLDLSSSPCLPSHLGDSGRKSMPKNCSEEGTADRPSISRQFGLIKNTRMTEKSWPTVIIAVLIAINLPLISIGATSDK